MSWQTIRADITIEYPQLTISGDVLYDPEQCALVHHDPAEGDEWLTIDLTTSGHAARPGECFVKDWSEHSGFAAALASAGIVEVLELVGVGPFNSHAYRVRVIEHQRI